MHPYFFAVNISIHVLDISKFKKIGVSEMWRWVVAVCIHQVLMSNVDPRAVRVNPYSAAIDFNRQILTSKVDPRTVRIKIFLLDVDP